MLIREKRNNKTQPINVIPAYQSEFISLEHADIVCPGMENRNAGWKKNLMLAGWLRKSAGYGNGGVAEGK